MEKCNFCGILKLMFLSTKRQVFYLKKSLFRSEILFSVNLLDCSDAWALGPKFTDVGELVPRDPPLVCFHVLFCLRCEYLSLFIMFIFRK